MYAESLRVSRETLGDTHPKSLIMMYNYTALLMRLGQWERAEKLAEECVRSNVARFGPDHSETKDAEELLEMTKSRVSTR